MTTDDLHCHGTVYLAGTGRGPEGRSMLFRNPVAELRASSPDDVPGVLAELDAALAAGQHVAGFVGYDAGDAGLPCAWFGVFTDVDKVGPPSAWPGGDEEPSVGPLVPRGGPDAFIAGVRAVRELIREGDVYQINLTTQFEGTAVGTAPDLFAHLWRRQPVPFGACLCLDGAHILSWSPELFFRRDGRRIRTRPMKGTHARGRTGTEDARYRAWLAGDEKSRAENLMIVDLLRNDLSVVCEPGSVRVPGLFEVETYPSVLQMTSTVEGTLRSGTSYADLFAAMFPCGSVTGAPKRRAMQRIAELEPGPRGVYCGAIGYASPGGEARFSVAIRTAVVRDGRFSLGAGAGIVWDSDPDAEYAETVLKTRFLYRDVPSFRLLETARAEADGRIPLWDRHVERLQASAAYFGWEVDMAVMARTVSNAIESYIRDQKTLYKIKEITSGIRVRITVGGAGDVEVSLSAAPAPPTRPLVIGMSDIRVDSEDLYLFHKTTHRPAYDAARRQAEARGWADALLVNERGCVTEGSITNIFVRHGDRWSTPPVADGLLGGVSRAVFMEQQAASGRPVVERSLTPAEVAAADAIVVTNAVLGSAAAEFVHG